MDKKTRRSTRPDVPPEPAQAGAANTADTADAAGATADALAAATARIAELEAKLAETETRATDSLAGWQRAQADLDNYRRRTERDRDDLARFAAQNVIMKLLPIVDNLDLAVKSADAAAEANSAVAPVRDGIALIHKQFYEVLAKEGVQPIEAAGQPFDPEFHEAVMRIDTDEHPDGTVVADLRRGWTMHGKVIRATMCQVSRQP